ncbi:MAG: thiamine-phosphate kinase, partial [Algiphilus sp.]
GLARAAVDLSDGLLADVGHICDASHLGADIRADLLPASEALQAMDVPEAQLLEWQGTGGEDYELALAIAPDLVQHAVARCAEAGTALTVVGRFRRGSGVRLLRTDGTEIEMERGGYSHF